MQYPFRSHRRQFIHVNLPDNSVFEKLNEELSQTLKLEIGGEDKETTLQDVQENLATFYGGDPEDYPTHRMSTSHFLVKLPYYLKPEVVEQEINRWAQQLGVSAAMYRSPWRSFRHHVYLVKVRISNYPLEFWDDVFFDIITEGFGKVKEVLEVDDEECDRGSLVLWIECMDPNAIPEYIIMDFWIKWRMCKVEVEQWRLAASPTNREGVPLMHEDEFRMLATGTFNGDWQTTNFRSLQNVHQRYLHNHVYRDNGGNVDRREAGGEGEEEEIGLQDYWRKRCMGSDHIPGPCKQRNNVKANEVRSCSREAREWSILTQFDQEFGDKVAHSDQLIKFGDFMVDLNDVKQCGEVVIGSNVMTSDGYQPPYKNEVQSSENSDPFKLSGMDFWDRNTERAPQRMWEARQLNARDGSQQAHWRKGDDLLSHNYMKEFGRVVLSNNTDSVYKNEYLKVNTQSVPLSLTSAKGTVPLPIPSRCASLNSISLSFTSHTAQSRANLCMEDTRDLSDDDFLKQFAELSAGAQAPKKITLSKEAEASTNWAMCLLLRVCTDIIVLADGFARQMAMAWKIPGGVKIKALEQKNHFLAEFSVLRDLISVRGGAPWVYRSDYVALQQITHAKEVTDGLVSSIEVWVQVHGRALELLSQQGMEMIVSHLGKPVSQAMIHVSGGRRYIRVKIRMGIESKLTDQMEVELPTLGKIMIYVVYERMGRHCF